MGFNKKDFQMQREGHVTIVAGASDESRNAIMFEDEPGVPERRLSEVREWLALTGFKHRFENFETDGSTPVRETFIIFENDDDALLFRMAHDCA